MIIPWLIQLVLAIVGLAVSLALVVAVCYVALELLAELFKESDNGNN